MPSTESCLSCAIAVLLSTLLYGSESWNTSPEREMISSVPYKMPEKNSWHLLCLLCISMCQMKWSSREQAKYRSSTSYNTDDLLGWDMSPVCIKYACLVACSTGSHEDAVIRADSACAGETVLRDLQDSGLSLDEVTVAAQDHKEWQSFMLALCRPGLQQQ